jgi:hypothetical protein
MAVGCSNEYAAILVAQPPGDNFEVATRLNRVRTEKMPHCVVTETRQSYSLAGANNLKCRVADLENARVGRVERLASSH